MGRSMVWVKGPQDNHEMAKGTAYVISPISNNVIQRSLYWHKHLNLYFYNHRDTQYVAERFDNETVWRTTKNLDDAWLEHHTGCKNEKDI